MDLDWIETTLILFAAIGAYIWANLTARRPVDLLRPRMIPPVLVMSVSAVIALVMLAHMVSLTSGTPFRGGN